MPRLQSAILSYIFPKTIKCLNISQFKIRRHQDTWHRSQIRSADTLKYFGSTVSANTENSNRWSEVDTCKKIGRDSFLTTHRKLNQRNTEILCNMKSYLCLCITRGIRFKTCLPCQIISIAIVYCYKIWSAIMAKS